MKMPKNFYKIDKNFSLKKEKEEAEIKKKEEKNLLSYEIGFYLTTPIILGVFLGYYLDMKFNTKPLLVLLGIFLGTIASFYNLFKLTK